MKKKEKKEINELKRRLDFQWMENFSNDIKELKLKMNNLEEELKHIKNYFSNSRSNIDGTKKYDLTSLNNLIFMFIIYISLFVVVLYGIFNKHDWKVYYSAISVMIIIFVLFKECLNNEKK